MGWEHLQRYRGRAVVGQAQIEKNSNGTPSAVLLIEVGMGPNQGQRLRYRGYLNSETNAASTCSELRAMGCKLARLGDWTGLGSKEVEFTCLSEVGQDGKTYYRAAFIAPVKTVNAERAAGASDIDALNAKLGGVLSQTNANGAAVVPGSAPEGGGEEIPF